MVKRNRKSTAGFSLLEFLAVMVLVAVLALIAVPIYDSYIKKARFQNVIVAVDSFKHAVAACAQQTGGNLTVCNHDANGVLLTTAPALATTGDYIASVTVSGNGVIMGTASKNGGLADETYILTPTLTGGGTSGVLTWTSSGSCSTNGLCDISAPPVL